MSIDNEIRKALERHESDVQTQPGAWHEVERSIGRSHRRRLAVMGACAALAVAGAAIALPRIGTRSQPAPIISQPPSTGKPSPAPSTTKNSAQPKVIAKIPVNAIALASNQNAIWAITQPSVAGKPGTLVKIDAATNRVIDRIQVGVAPVALAATSDSVWVSNGPRCGAAPSCSHGATPASGNENSVWRIDASNDRVLARIPVAYAGDIAAGEGAVWVNGDRLYKIDPATNRVVLRAGAPGNGAVHLAAGAGYLWTTSSSGQSETIVGIFDPKDLTLVGTVRIPTRDTFGDVTTGNGSAWVTTNSSTSASALARIDPISRRVTVTITLPDAAPIGLMSVTSGQGFVWATSVRGYLWRVDPTTNKPLGGPVLIGAAPPENAPDAVTGFGSVWVASADGHVWRLS